VPKMAVLSSPRIPESSVLLSSVLHSSSSPRGNVNHSLTQTHLLAIVFSGAADLGHKLTHSHNEQEKQIVPRMAVSFVLLLQSLG
jgi:hypothetical protein